MWHASLALSLSWKHQINLAKVPERIAELGHALVYRHKPRLTPWSILAASLLSMQRSIYLEK